MMHHHMTSIDSPISVPQDPRDDRATSHVLRQFLFDKAAVAAESGGCHQLICRALWRAARAGARSQPSGPKSARRVHPRATAPGEATCGGPRVLRAR